MHLNLVAMLEPKRTIINCYKQNMSQSKIGEIIGCSQAYVSKIITSYQLSGDSIFGESCKNNKTEPKLSDVDLVKLATLL